MKQGFYTALGTPLDGEGNLIPESLSRQIEDQIAAGAAGLLLMGTMGMLGCIRNDVYEDLVAVASKAVKGRVRLLVGAFDNSLSRVKSRFDILKKYPVDAAVLTPPYYFKMDKPTLMNFFRGAAALTDMDIYLYDHEPITKHKISLDMVTELSGLSNIRGIKSGDLVLIKALYDSTTIKKNFLPIFSGSDLFAVSNIYGIKNYLDGIFACFPATIREVQLCFDKEDFEGAKKGLARLMGGRDEMIALGIWPAFSHAMNLLGYAGNHAPDYELPLSEASKEKVADILRRCGELR